MIVTLNNYNDWHIYNHSRFRKIQNIFSSTKIRRSKIMFFFSTIHSHIFHKILLMSWINDAIVQKTIKYCFNTKFYKKYFICEKTQNHEKKCFIQRKNIKLYLTILNTLYQFLSSMTSTLRIWIHDAILITFNDSTILWKKCEWNASTILTLNRQYVDESRTNQSHQKRKQYFVFDNLFVQSINRWSTYN